MREELLTLILQDLIVFPVEEIKLEFNNEVSKKIINESINNYNGELLIVTPKNKLEKSPDLKDLNEIGIKVNIKKKIILPNGNVRVTVRGIKRCQIKSSKIKNGFIFSITNNITSPEFEPDTELAYNNKIKDLVAKYVNESSDTSNHIIALIGDCQNLSKVVDMVSSSLNLDKKVKAKLFNETNYYKRAKMLIRSLNAKIKETDLDKEIEQEVRDNLHQNEQDILIKEKIKILNSKLNTNSDNKSVTDEYLNRLEDIKVNDKVKKAITEEIERLSHIVDTSPEYSIVSSHIDFLLDLPWDKASKDITKNFDESFDNLNKLHYGMMEAKTRIEEYLMLKSKNKSLPSPVLCLVGPPGTGKTTFARELAASIGRKFIKVSVGGLNDSSEIIGHRRTYLGASPGKILDGIRKSGVNNPIILIDEVDKMVKDYHGDPASTLLDVLDSNQNKYFVDNYAGVEFNLSNVIFVLTANDLDAIPSALRDRLEIIEVNSYTLLDKINIAKKYTMPRLGKEYNFDSEKIHFNDSVLTKLIMEYTNEAGVRDLERNIASIVRKNLIKGLEDKVVIKEKDLEKYLGASKYSVYTSKYTSVGVANMAAKTKNGGAILCVESAFFPGKGISFTGNLGDIAKESALVAIDYLKANAKKLKIDGSKFKNALHIHMINNACKKDGPSGGLAITSSLVSLLSNKVIPNNIAFTGEITLNGDILKVGGIEEKIISAYNLDMKKIYIPMDNIKDLNGLNSKIVKAINIVPVNNFTEVYNDIFN